MNLPPELIDVLLGLDSRKVEADMKRMERKAKKEEWKKRMKSLGRIERKKKKLNRSKRRAIERVVRTKNEKDSL